MDNCVTESVIPRLSFVNFGDAVYPEEKPLTFVCRPFQIAPLWWTVSPHFEIFCMTKGQTRFPTLHPSPSPDGTPPPFPKVRAFCAGVELYRLGGRSWGTRQLHKKSRGAAAVTPSPFIDPTSRSKNQYRHYLLSLKHVGDFKLPKRNPQQTCRKPNCQKSRLLFYLWLKTNLQQNLKLSRVRGNKLRSLHDFSIWIQSTYIAWSMSGTFQEACTEFSVILRVMQCLPTPKATSWTNKSGLPTDDNQWSLWFILKVYGERWFIWKVYG